MCLYSHYWNEKCDSLHIIGAKNVYIHVLDTDMKFERSIYKSLKIWQKDGKKKPLLLMGARQIGKTTLLKTFGSDEYEDFIYLNFEKQRDIHAFFTGNKDPETILENISLLYGKEIEEESCLIILDEIQECKDALIALKYFAEERPGIHLVGAGSLLGLSIGNDRSFPVGKVQFLHMYPLTFEEYLQAADSKLYKSYLHYLATEELQPLQEAFFTPLKALYKEYTLFGGMPEVASEYLVTRDVEKAQAIQDQILLAYSLDFVKHAQATTSTKIQQVWESIPSQLAKENKKFVYKLIKSGARAREYEVAILWLIQAGLLYKISNVSTPAIPVKAYENISVYKLYVFESGLLIRLAGLDPKVFIHGDLLFTEFRGALAENQVSQALAATMHELPCYWTSDGKAEIDFIISKKNYCIPVEVKSGTATKAKSLSVYKEKYQPELRIRVSNKNLSLDGDLLNVPLFYAERISELVGKVVGGQK